MTTEVWYFLSFKALLGNSEVTTIKATSEDSRVTLSGDEQLAFKIFGARFKKKDRWRRPCVGKTIREQASRCTPYIDTSEYAGLALGM